MTEIYVKLLPLQYDLPGVMHDTVNSKSMSGAVEGVSRRPRAVLLVLGLCCWYIPGCLPAKAQCHPKMEVKLPRQQRYLRKTKPFAHNPHL